MADSGRFVDMLHGVNWQDGLHLEVSNGKSPLSLSTTYLISFSRYRLAVESYIAKGRDGIAEGISGEGSLLDNAKGQRIILEER